MLQLGTNFPNLIFLLCLGKELKCSIAFSLLTQSWAGLKCPVGIKVIEMVKGQQEKRRLRGRRSRIKQFGAIYQRNVEKCCVCFLEEVSDRSHRDFYCGTLDNKITRMKGLYSVIWKLKNKTKQSDTLRINTVGVLPIFEGVSTKKPKKSWQGYHCHTGQGFLLLRM